VILFAVAWRRLLRLLDIVRGAGTRVALPDSAGLIFVQFSNAQSRQRLKCCRAWLTGR
jgi:hypothetical protein